MSTKSKGILQTGHLRMVLRPYIQIGFTLLLVLGVVTGWAGDRWIVVTAIVVLMGSSVVLLARYARVHGPSLNVVKFSALSNSTGTAAIILLTGGARSRFWMLLILGAITSSLSLRGKMGVRMDRLNLFVISLILIVPALLPIPDIPELGLASMQIALAFVSSLIIRTAGEQLLVTQDELANSEARFRDMTDHIEDVFYLTDLEGPQLLYISPAFETVWGRSQDEAYEKVTLFTEDIFEEDQPAVFLALDQQAKGQPTQVEYRIRRVSDGSVRWIRDESFPIAGNIDQAGRVAGLAKDITEEREIAQAFHRSELRFRSLVEAAQDSIFILDIDQRIQYSNQAAAKMLRTTSEALLGTIIGNLFSEQEGTGQGDTIDRVIASKEMHYREHYLDFGDERVWIGARLVPILDAEEEIQALLGISRDITSQREHALEIQNLNEDLEARVEARTRDLAEKNKELEKFTYSVSHDLKAPLRGIDGYSRIMLDQYQDELSPEARELLGLIRESTHQMNNLISDLLSYSRLEQRNVTMEPIRLAPLVEGLLSERQIELDRLNFDVTIELECQRVFVERGGFMISVRNLIDNAIKFSRPQEKSGLRIYSYPTDVGCVLAFADSGQGFDMQYHDKIFLIFERLNLAEDYPGTGVGLALVSKAMSRMGGARLGGKRTRPGHNVLSRISLRQTQLSLSQKRKAKLTTSG